MSSVIQHQRRSTPSGVRDLCQRRTELFQGMNLASNSWFTAITRFFYMPQSWDMGHIFYFPCEGRHADDFYRTGKIQRLRPGSNPRTRVPEAIMLTTRPPELSLRVLVETIATHVMEISPKMVCWIRSRHIGVLTKVILYNSLVLILCGYYTGSL
jgi:hypothetical protein